MNHNTPSPIRRLDHIEDESDDRSPRSDLQKSYSDVSEPRRARSKGKQSEIQLNDQIENGDSAVAEVKIVKKARSAFVFYQADNLSKIRAELGAGASMGDTMSILSQKWKNLAEDEKESYFEKERLDKQRYLKESREADELAAQAQEQRRLKNTVVKEGEGRSARKAVDTERQKKQEQAEKRRQQELERQRRIDEGEYEETDLARERRLMAKQKKQEVEERRKKRADEEQALTRAHKKLDKEEAKKAAARLDYLLQQSSIFAKLSGGKGSLPQAGEKDEKKTAAKDSNKTKTSHHRNTKASASSDNEKVDEQDLMEADEELQKHVFLTQQPSCIKFGKLKAYQLEALNWMIHLAEKGLNGILADEMGLGKTVQSISILAYHYEFLNVQGPHLVCVPKSTLSNWMNELARWCPSLRAIKFHGAREDREYLIDTFFTNEAAAHDGKRPIDLPKIKNTDKGPGSDEYIDDNTNNPRQWDVCVTTYEVANTEQRVLRKFAWKYLIIDEAHRLKNDASMFSKTVRSFKTANRLLLTGTPLQNNLHELWALLNFLLPDIFSSADQFDEWFDLEIDDEEAKKNIISQLHKILRPFMLRRLKADVAKGLPPKTETILMVGMSKMQKNLYKNLLLRDLDSITGKASGKSQAAILNIVMQLRKCCGHPYLFEGVEDRTLDPLGEHLVENCGKLSMVDKLLKRLKERGSRVLIFTQMTRILDIMEDFMFMRGYKYCRIDGNTNYEDREQSIEDFNREGSDKFCFLLSTRAGGLGINLQTADTCILYDSDWNPQQDLQAQDRCHRLGQTKPVNVFRLVSENTVEEKIVERAQQKLKLDAMVVQQGRLKDKDKVTKEEIMAAVRFGADTIFRSDESTITDEDIDVILERGIAKTKELNEKIQKADKGDLLDFRLDGGISAQTFEGIDYSDKGLREHLRMLAANSVGKRERRPPPSSYNPIIQSKKSMVVNNRRIKLPKALRLPQMEDHHFYNRERLLELGRLEFENYAALRERGAVPPKEILEREKSLLPPEMAQEKRELIAEGFGNWSRSQYYHFIKACAKYGRDDFAKIAFDMDRLEEEIEAYSEAFWKYGSTELKNEWERVVANIQRGEKKLEKQKKLSALLKQFVSTFENPRREMTFANKGTAHFALEQDRALLCAVEKHGYGNWDSVREEIRTDSRLRLQHTVQGMTVQAIAKRCDYRMRQMEKELEAREKVLKNQRPAAVSAARKAIETIKEMDEWDLKNNESMLEGRDPISLNLLSEDGRAIMQERLKDREANIYRLREIEVQVQKALQAAEETRQTIYDGAQYINYSNITLKCTGPGSSSDKDSKGGLSIQDSIELEARINKQILKVRPCLLCQRCLSSKLCVKRLEVRERLLAEAHSGDGAGRKKMKKRKVEPPPKLTAAAVKPLVAPKQKKKLMMKKPDGQLKPRVTSQGNKRMTIPDELFPEFCRRIGAQGTGERMNVINRFVEDHPTISVRQVTMKLSEITTRTKPSCVVEPSDREKKSGRAFMFYLRPCFYKHLPVAERPADWERYAAEDEIRFKDEKEQRKLNRNTSHNGSSDGQRSSAGSQSGDDNDDVDETEDEGEPDAKRTKTSDETDNEEGSGSESE